jgi:uncharacterized protein (DUF2235 family)
MPRNLVICCDGTNNSLVGPPTNVRHLYRLAKLPDASRQFAYYDAGVGVDELPSMRTRIGGTLSRWSGSAFGTGLVDNVAEAYKALVENYADGDRIFLFGFSRGAYTVRVLAGLIQNYGLLKPEHAAEYRKVVKAYRDLYPRAGFKNDVATPAQQARFNEARLIRTQQGRDCPIHFLGAFDTVSSLGWAWDPQTFGNTFNLPNVKIVRHAMALDERRAKFRTNRVKILTGADQQQMWFAGVHSDVGGGYKGERARLSRIPLRWMLNEAIKAGMIVNTAVADELRLEQTWKDDEQAEQNESLTTLWRALEFVPLPHWERDGDNEWVERKKVYACKGWRDLPDTFDAHESLQRRRKAVKNVNWEKSQPSINYRH